MLVEGPEPQLQARVLAALEGKPVRLTRIVQVRAQAAGPPAIARHAADLAELKPEAVFAELFARAHGDAPPADLLRAFETLLIDVQTTGGTA